LSCATAAVLLLSWATRLLSAPPAYTAIATSERSFSINGANVTGLATLLAGDAVETREFDCQIRLKDGRRIRLGNNSKIRLSPESVEVLGGSTRIFEYTAIAHGLTITTDRAGSGTVAVQGQTVNVGSLIGTVHVYNRQGVPIASLAARQAAHFTPESSGAQTYSLTGCAVRSGADLLLTDVASGLTVELRGAKVPAGHVVRVNGTAVAGEHLPAAAQAITVEEVRPLPGKCGQRSTGVVVGAAGVAAGTAGVALGSGAATATVAAAGGALVAGVAVVAAQSAGFAATTSPSVQTPNCASPCLLH
jgi:hypothetical protein